MTDQPPGQPERRTSAAVGRRELRRRIVIERQAHFDNREEAAKTLGWSLRKQVMLENGESTPSARDLERIFAVLQVAAEEQSDWLQLADGARAKGWWDRFHDAELAPAAKHYAALEWGARRVRAFSGSLVTSLLQTADYTRAVLRAGAAPRSTEQVERLVDVRRRRKAILEPPDPLTLHVVLDEAALHRSAGPGVMGPQIAHILDLIDTHPNVTVQVVPFSAGLYPGQSGVFTLLDFGYPDDAGIAQIEPGLLDPVYAEDLPTIYLYSQMFEKIVHEVAASPAETVEVLRRAHQALGAGDG